jgi:hypothetical protein
MKIKLALLIDNPERRRSFEKGINDWLQTDKPEIHFVTQSESPSAQNSYNLTISIFYTAAAKPR